MRRLSALALPILAAALVACSSSAAPGWTYAPVPSASAGASGAAGSPSASGGASSAPSTAPSTAASAGASASATASGGGSTVLTIKAPVGASTGGFDPTTLSASAGKPFTIHFDNEDNQAAHNVVVKAPDGGQVQLGGDTNFFTGPGERDYQVPALTAGTYEYNCVVHPTTMKGTLTIQ
jgi:plastocyanin